MPFRRSFGQSLLTIKVTVWQGRCHLFPQAFQGNHLGAGKKKKKAEDQRGPRTSHLLGRGQGLPREKAASPISADTSVLSTVWGQGLHPKQWADGDPQAEVGTLCGCRWAQSWSRWKTPSLHSMIQCSSMGASCSLEAAMAMPKPTSRTRPPEQTERLGSIHQAQTGEAAQREGRGGPWHTQTLPQGGEGKWGRAEGGHNTAALVGKSAGPGQWQGGSGRQTLDFEPRPTLLARRRICPLPCRPPTLEFTERGQGGPGQEPLGGPSVPQAERRPMHEGTLGVLPLHGEPGA